jgi:hypothetical protein
MGIGKIRGPVLLLRIAKKPLFFFDTFEVWAKMGDACEQAVTRLFPFFALMVVNAWFVRVHRWPCYLCAVRGPSVADSTGRR